MNYKKLLDDLYEEAKDYCDSKYEFISNDVFDFTTYDSEIDKKFSSDMLEVISVILNKECSSYHGHGEKQENYLKYITMINMPFLKNKIDWGTSIRNVWFDSLSDGDYHINFSSIPKSDIEIFLRDLIDWSND